MKIEELFKKAGKLFGMKKDAQIKKVKKSKKLILLLREKIALLKHKIKETDDKVIKKELKREIEILKTLKKECEKI